MPKISAGCKPAVDCWRTGEEASGERRVGVSGGSGGGGGSSV